MYETTYDFDENNWWGRPLKYKITNQKRRPLATVVALRPYNFQRPLIKMAPSCIHSQLQRAWMILNVNIATTAHRLTPVVHLFRTVTNAAPTLSRDAWTRSAHGPPLRWRKPFFRPLLHRALENSPLLLATFSKGLALTGIDTQVTLTSAAFMRMRKLRIKF